MYSKVSLPTLTESSPLPLTPWVRSSLTHLVSLLTPSISLVSSGTATAPLCRVPTDPGSPLSLSMSPTGPGVSRHCPRVESPLIRECFYSS